MTSRRSSPGWRGSRSCASARTSGPRSRASISSAVAAFGERRRGAADGRRRDRAQPREDRGRDRQRARRARRAAGRADLVVRAADPRPRGRARAPTCRPSTPESTALAKALKKRGFRFVGPTTAYALMQACGLVDDHIEGCCVLSGLTAGAARRRRPRALRRGRARRARARRAARTRSSTSSRRSTGAPRWTARRARSAGPPTSRCCSSLRAVADAVLIGPGTVRAEGYGRLGRPGSGAPTSPPAVLISRRFDIPWEAGLFAAADQPVIVYTLGRRAASRPTSPRRSRSCGCDECTPGGGARRPARPRRPRAAERGRPDAVPRLPRRRPRRRAVPDAHAADDGRRGRDRDRLRRAARRIPRG